ncbi:NAD(P)/FAD-dependent oxidoreductase [Rhodobium gokarnense]|uniref:Glycine/D-amino acid oxidase-like deaminating enzyme n=1 Tax=Rhodobium gokarnense TaxID=364296 RepID=A0ABT3HGU4_9HYPH|nr:FAD-binding oxidoreductase [Rhodobium gokarnense]MCW2309544.1 glycine/D-amino acid oxidase-like deaminating enzyme [Rhodobium gokarnense]
MPARYLYHPAAHDGAQPVPSYWEAITGPLSRETPPLTGAARCDVAVIGAGYTGLAAAEALAGTHGMDVRVLEAGTPGWGASGRNGGFCCLGGSSFSTEELVRRFGKAAATRFYQVQLEAIDQVRAFLKARDCVDGFAPSGEMVLAHKPNRVAELRHEADLIKDLLGLETPVYSREELVEMGFAGPGFYGGALEPYGFPLNPLAYARARAEAAIDAGAAVHSFSAVRDWTMEDGRHILRCDNGTVSARYVLVATNGYSSETLPEWMSGRTLPVMSNILVTRPLTASEWSAQGWTTDRMSFDTRIILHYFRRLPDGRFLFGGRGALDASPEAKPGLEAGLRRRFEKLFPAWKAVETDYCWQGFICLARNFVPFAGPIPGVEGAFAALAYHGNGVAFSGWAGQAIADCVAGRDGAEDAIPEIMRTPLKRFETPNLRLFGLRLALARYDFIDRFL